MQGGGMCLKTDEFLCWEFYIQHCSLKICVITLPIIALLNDKRPKGGPLTGSEDTLLGCVNFIRGVAGNISINTDPFIPDFCIYSIYIDTTLYLQL